MTGEIRYNVPPLVSFRCLKLREASFISGANTKLILIPPKGF